MIAEILLRRSLRNVNSVVVRDEYFPLDCDIYSSRHRVVATRRTLNRLSVGLSVTSLLTTYVRPNRFSGDVTRRAYTKPTKSTTVLLKGFLADDCMLGSWRSQTSDYSTY